MADDPGKEATVPGEATGSHVTGHPGDRPEGLSPGIPDTRLRADGGETGSCVRCGTDMPKNARYCSACRAEQGSDPAQYPSQSRKSTREAVETPDSDPAFRRRGVLIGGAASFVGAAYLLREPVMGIMNGVIHSVGRYWRDQQLSEVGLLDVTWINGTLVLEFDPDHRADGWSVAHVQSDQVDGAIALGTTDVEGGSLELPFETILEERGAPLPDTSLVYTAFEGSFGNWSTDPGDHEVESALESVQFDAPEDAVPTGE